MGNLCNCFVPKNVDPDFDVESMTISSNCKEMRRGNAIRYTHLGEYEIISNPMESNNIDGLRRHSCETCYSNGRHTNEDNIFTISSSSSHMPSPVAYRDSLLLGYSSTHNPAHHSSLLESVENFYNTTTTTLVDEKQRRKTHRIWSLRPDSFLHSISSTSCMSPGHLRLDFISEKLQSGVVSSSTSSLLHFGEEKKTDALSMSEQSFDSGFGAGATTTTATSIDMSSLSSCCSPNAVVAVAAQSPPSPSQPVNHNYLVVAQTSKYSDKPRSLFRFLFDLSHLIRDALFEWPTTYVHRIKQNLVEMTTGRRQASLTWRRKSPLFNKPQQQQKNNQRKDDDVESSYIIIDSCENDTSSSNLLDKPIGIMGLLSKLNLFKFIDSFNLFNLFRPTVTAAAHSKCPNATPYGFNPLRDFFLRLFDINFF